MGLIQDQIRKFRDKKRYKNEYAQQRNVEEDYAEKKLNSNERELNRYREEERQKRIKQILERYRKIENDRVWRGQQGNPLYAKDVVKDQKKLFTSGNMFSRTPSVVKGKNVIKCRNIFCK